MRYAVPAVPVAHAAPAPLPEQGALPFARPSVFPPCARCAALKRSVERAWAMVADLAAENEELGRLLRPVIDRAAAELTFERNRTLSDDEGGQG